MNPRNMTAATAIAARLGARSTAISKAGSVSGISNTIDSTMYLGPYDKSPLQVLLDAIINRCATAARSQRCRLQRPATISLAAHRENENQRRREQKDA